MIAGRIVGPHIPQLHDPNVTAIFALPMRGSILHIVFCLLLSALYAVEPGLPCVDEDCRAARAADAGCVPDAANAIDRQNGRHAHDSQSGSQPQHCCDHCACACHTPALVTQYRIAFIGRSSTVRYMPLACNPPTAAINPPDHIPLV
ncbi:MAG TPA: hypothetical protein VHI13_02615 [Candidatus Kapabacteria bacterium]|nr:hypothetical protein [Candidatus Kapabacteria bacterium]